MTTRFFSLLICFLLLLPSAAVAGRRVPDVVEDALAFALTDRSKAVQLLEDALEAEPESRDRSAIAVNAGEQRRLAGDSDASHAWFTDVLAGGDKGPDNDAARLGLALLQAGDPINARTLSLLGELSERNALATQNADRFYLLALHAKSEGDDTTFKAHAKKARTYAKEDPKVLERIKQGLQAAREGSTPPPVATNTADDPKKTGKLDKADAALASGDKETARRLAEDVRDNATDPVRIRAAEYLLRRIDGAPVSARKVAVLLPLEGRYGAVGSQVQQALRFGHREGGAPFSLEFIDSGATPETAVAALEDAIINGGAIAAVGPLLTDETEAVVDAAEALRVPLLSLSQSLEDLGDRRFVLQAMMSPGDQIRALLDQAMGTDEMDSFAVFAPQNSYGERVVEIFQNEVAARDGTIAVTTFYDPAATDLIEFAKTMGRKDYEARSAEYWDLRKNAEERGGDPTKVVLPPILDFDAIFLPDNASRVPLACAALAYEEFPMGDFYPTKESPFVPVLGLSGWNNSTLVSTGGPYARRSYFTDAFLNEMSGEEPAWQQSEAQEAFVVAYKAENKRTPSPLEALVVDVGRLLAAAGKERPTTRADMLAALLEVQPESNVAGTRGIDPETRRAARDLLILSISEDAIVPRSELPAPEVER